MKITLISIVVLVGSLVAYEALRPRSQMELCMKQVQAREDIKPLIQEIADLQATTTDHIYVQLCEAALAQGVKF